MPDDPSTTRHAVAQALARAQRDRQPVDPVAGDLPGGLDEAYEVQELVIAHRESTSNPRVGRKVGLTSRAVQEQLGVDQPDFGVLLRDMEVADGGTIPADTLLQPKIEAEVAFILGADITDPRREAVVDAVDSVVASLEIVDSRIRDWKISIVDTVADNASNGLFVLGTDRRSLQSVDTVSVSMTLSVNGEERSRGTGADCLGDPLNALVWVARRAVELGRPLQAGEVVLSGALGPMVPLMPGDHVEANIEGLGTVSASLSGAGGGR